MKKGDTVKVRNELLVAYKQKGKVIIVDDVYATGGTMNAAEDLCKLSGYEVIGSVCFLNIGLVKNPKTKCLISY